MTENDFKLVTPRKTIEVTLDTGEVIQGLRGAPLEKFIKVVQASDKPLIVGAIVDSSLRELTFPLTKDVTVTPLTMESKDGALIYRRSLTFLLEVAFKRSFPRGELTIDHSVSSGGFYCQIEGVDDFGPDSLAKLKTAMQSLVKENVPFRRETVPLDEALNYFRSVGEDDKVGLLKYRKRKDLVLYSVGDIRDYHHGYMVPSSGYLKWFDLTPMGDAFILRFPQRGNPSKITPMKKYPTLLKAFHEYGDWLNKLGIPSVGALNDAIQDGHGDEVILVSEAFHEMQVSEIAEAIHKKRDKVGVILIAGPSSSGKTTFSKRLSIQLLARGITPFPLEMDNFFWDREKTPPGADGKPDFEALSALNLPRLNHDVKALLAGEEVQLPYYNFKTGINEPGEVAKLEKDTMIIIEGIHGLNPGLFRDLAADQTFRIYASCLTQLNLDRHNRISTTDTRMLRRIARDARDRGYSAEVTISRFEAVRRGEKEHIFPFQENADVMFNSALAYELGALKPVVEPLLRQVRFGTPEYIEAKRLLRFLEWFLPMDYSYIPNNSILREFIGGSALEKFELWEKKIN